MDRGAWVVIKSVIKICIIHFVMICLLCIGLLYPSKLDSWNVFIHHRQVMKVLRDKVQQMSLIWTVTFAWSCGSCLCRCATSWTRSRTCESYITELIAFTLRLVFDSKFSVNDSEIGKITSWTADEGSLSLHCLLYSADTLLSVLFASILASDLSNVPILIIDATDVVDEGARVSVRSRLV